jgi:hypothetical protein
MENYIDVLNANSELATREFSSLSEDQFNFKPSPDKWSIGQCILHLVKTNKSYFPIYERLSEGNYDPNFFEKMGWFSGFWEKFFVDGVDPKNVKKMKAPAAIQPAQSNIGKEIIVKFAEQNEKIASYYQSLQAKGIDKVIVSSPFAKFIVYNAACTFDIIALHEQRHLQQALQVRDMLK